jgi:ABC-type uncharacterized transport system substrate-binding protein
MSYGADILDMFHGVGVYTGKVLQGAKPADLPVQQTTKFELTINQIARALGIEVPSGLLAIADEARQTKMQEGIAACGGQMDYMDMIRLSTESRPRIP